MAVVRRLRKEMNNPITDSPAAGMVSLRPERPLEEDFSHWVGTIQVPTDCASSRWPLDACGFIGETLVS